MCALVASIHVAQPGHVESSSVIATKPTLWRPAWPPWPRISRARPFVNHRSRRAILVVNMVERRGEPGQRNLGAPRDAAAAANSARSTPRNGWRKRRRKAQKARQASISRDARVARGLQANKKKMLWGAGWANLYSCGSACALAPETAIAANVRGRSRRRSSCRSQWPNARPVSRQKVGRQILILARGTLKPERNAMSRRT
jgi:hypothetical protein